MTIVVIAASFLLSTLLSAGQETTPKTIQVGATDSYPNTAAALQRQLSEILAAAKNNDEGKVWSKVTEMEIPDYANWFTRNYGQEKGQELAASYDKSRKISEQQFELLWVELAKQEGEISIVEYDASNQKFNNVKSDDTLANPTELFKAIWKKTDTSVGPASQAIGYFCFVDGKFRLQVFPVAEVKILSPVKAGPVVAAKLIDKVNPVYPEAARQARIRGIVSLNVVVHKDGTVTVQNVGAGPAVLVPAAVAAVQQWKYRPTTVSGEPVEVEAKIYLTFELSQQKQ